MEILGWLAERTSYPRHAAHRNFILHHNHSNVGLPMRSADRFGVKSGEILLAGQ